MRLARKITLAGPSPLIFSTASSGYLLRATGTSVLIITKNTMRGVRVEKGWHQKSPTAVTASLETRPTMDGEPER